MTYGYYEGTGHFLYDYTTYMAVPGKAGSLETVDAEAFTSLFVIYADAVEDSEYDIGWRTGYRLKDIHICAVPFGSGAYDEITAAEGIIDFE